MKTKPAIKPDDATLKRHCLTLSVMEFPKMPKSPIGREMKQIGKTESGDDLLQDHQGRQYTRNRKGTMRRYKATLISDL